MVRYVTNRREEENSRAAELVSVRCIWDRAPWNGNSDLIRFRDRWFCAFREAEGHFAGFLGRRDDGTIRVIVSDNGEDWVSAAVLGEVGVDLRDPHLSVTPDGRLMVVAGGSFFTDTQCTNRRTRVSFSGDGLDWTGLIPVLGDQQWLWRVTWHEGRAYGINRHIPTPTRAPTDPYAHTRDRSAHLVVSDDGLNFEDVVEIGVPGPDESTVRFTETGEMIAMVRTVAISDAPYHGWIGRSAPPYDVWEWAETEHRFGGPYFIILPDGDIWGGSRGYPADTPKGPGAGTTILAKMTPGSFDPVITLPSGGDCSYPGLVWHEGLLWVSYYSSHEGNTNQYLAKVRLSEG